jgi:predicted dehydrogenase
MNILIVGLGSIGSRHARNFKAFGVGEVAGFDPDASRRKRFSTEIGGPVFTDLQEAVQTKFDLAVIASPNRFHVEQAILCAEAGFHLLIEKPLGVDLTEIDRLLLLVEEQGLFVHMGSNWKFHPAFNTMKRLIEEGVVGTITGAQVIAGYWLPDWHPWEDYRKGYSARRDLGGGVVLDNHEFDYLTWLLGPVTDVSGFTAHSGSLEIETEDVASVCMRFKNGALATLLLDYIQRDYRRSYHISGDAGTIEWDVRKGTVTVYRTVTQKEEVIDVDVKDVNEMYVNQSRHVLDGVAGKVAPLTSLAHAVQTLELQLQLVSNHV